MTSVRAHTCGSPYAKLRRSPAAPAGHTSGMNSSQHLVCACGNPTEMFCFFSDGDSHGVCANCGTVRLIELESGQIVSRWLCNSCWKNRLSRQSTIR